MNLRWLEDFLCLAETGNFTRASEQRFSTQSAFSRRIKALEYWAGAPLFNRDTQPVTLTDAGEAFRPYAETMVTTLLEGRSAVGRIAAQEDATTIFSATHSLALNFFPRWLAKARSRVGEFDLQLLCQSFEKSIAAIDAGLCHFVLCHAIPDQDQSTPANAYHYTVLGDEVLVPVCVADEQGLPLHPLPGRDEAPSGYLAYNDSSSLYHAITASGLSVSPPPGSREVFASDYASVLRSMTLEGQGFSWQPRRDISEDLEQGRLVIAAEPTWHIALQLRLYRSHEPLPAAARLVWEFACGKTPPEPA